MTVPHPADASYASLNLTSTEYALGKVLPLFRIAADAGAASFSMSDRDRDAGVEGALVSDGLIEPTDASGLGLSGTVLTITPKGRKALALREYRELTSA